MEADGKGTLEWPDPDLDFWPMSELSALNLSWLDQAELHGNNDASEAYERLVTSGEAKATSRSGQEVSARVSPSTRLKEGDLEKSQPLFFDVNPLQSFIQRRAFSRRSSQKTRQEVSHLQEL